MQSTNKVIGQVRVERHADGSWTFHPTRDWADRRHVIGQTIAGRILRAAECAAGIPEWSTPLLGATIPAHIVALYSWVLPESGAERIARFAHHREVHKAGEAMLAGLKDAEV